MMLELFAQMKKVVVNTPPPNAGAPDAAAAGGAMAFLGGMIILDIIFAISGLIQFIFMIMSLVAQSKSLTLCSSKRRIMEPGQVWLNLIPCWNIVWFIMTVLKVSESLMKEFKARGIKHAGDYAKGMGIFAYVTLFLGCIPLLGPIVFFLYWKKLGQVNLELEKGIRKAKKQQNDDDDDEDEEEEEERPRPKKRRPRDEDDDE